METKEQKNDYGKKYSNEFIAPSIHHRYYVYTQAEPLDKTAQCKKGTLVTEKKNGLASFLFPVVFLFALSALLFRLAWYLIFVAGIPIIASLWFQSYFETTYKLVSGLSFTFSTVAGILLCILIKKIIGNCELEEYYMRYQAAIGKK